MLTVHYKNVCSIFGLKLTHSLSKSQLQLKYFLPCRFRCRLKSYPDVTLQASLIICFHKEALSTLLRTVATVIERTPVNLLTEIILVDDFSDDGINDQYILFA